MGFAFGNYSDTSTWGNWPAVGSGQHTMPTFGGFPHGIQRVTEQMETLVESMRAARHRRSRYPLPVWPETLAIPAASFVAAVRSHRRTVVPRGTVSWIRAGTRRPL